MAANGHVALNSMQYDGWTMRFSEGHTMRANSVSVLYPSSLDPIEKIKYCEKQYAKQGLPCIFKLTEEDNELAEVLRSQGYSMVYPTDLMTLDLKGFPDTDMTGLVFTDDSEWLPVYFRFEEINDAHKKDVFSRMLSRVLVDTVYCILTENDVPVACASLAIERGYALLHNVIVDKTCRGKGLGEKLVRGILKKAEVLGTKEAYLQVVESNNAAVNLYRKLGFEKLYTYMYFKKD